MPVSDLAHACCRLDFGRSCALAALLLIGACDSRGTGEYSDTCPSNEDCRKGLICHEYMCSEDGKGDSDCDCTPDGNTTVGHCGSVCRSGYGDRECEIKRDCAGNGATCQSGACRFP